MGLFAFQLSCNKKTSPSLMKKQEFFKILRKYQAGTASEEEKSFLSAYYNLFEAEPDITEMLSSDKKILLKDQIKAGIQKEIVMHGQKPARPYLFLRRIAAAAIIFVVLGVGITLYVFKASLFDGYHYAKNNIAPGGNKAVLTLANGTQIVLTNAKNGIVAQQGATSIRKPANGQIVYDASNTGKISDTSYNTITVPKGGQYLVVLPDSSKVYLNSASSLRFPAAFAGKIRSVALTGEAYFEIAHNKSKPFHVVTGSQTVEVLGTHFNINAYDDERSVKTTLLEGSVKVSMAGNVALLTPGEQSQVIHEKDLSSVIKVVQDANTDEAIAWKNGYFQFENADIQTVMRQYSRWYDVKIIYEGKIKERFFSGQIHRNLSAAQALDLLNYIDVHFTINGKTIIVSP